MVQFNCSHQHILLSEFSVFNPKIPFTLAIPSGGICNKEQILIVGVMLERIRKLPEISITSDDGTELFHVQINKAEDTIYRWAAINQTITEKHGKVNDHTTIDLEEPFTMVITCDEDGWVLKINSDPSYPNYFHIDDPASATKVKLSGDMRVTYVGIGDESK